MITYSEFRPTPFDAKGLGCDYRQDWLVAPVSQTRDSDALDRSNFETMQRILDDAGGDYEVHRFGHWGPGWFEIILVEPGTKCASEAEECEGALANYPVLDDENFCELETQEADEVWRECYTVADRIEYIRNASPGEFEFGSFADLLGCVRGHYFAGYASEPLS